MSKALKLLILFLGLSSSALAADTKLCADDDNNGIIDVLKAVGKIDRDCDGAPSVADGGTDCDDTTPFIHDLSYTISGCNVGAYRYCEAGVYKTAPGGSSAVANGGVGCTTTTIAEKTNNYYVSATGSGTSCLNNIAAPCLPSAVSSGGAVTPVAPYAIYTVGSTDFSGSMKLAIVVSGTSAGNKSIVARDPLSTAKWNTSSGCVAPCSTITTSANNLIIRGNIVTAGDSTSSGGIRPDGNEITVFDNWVHDAVGANNNNVAGIYIKDGGLNLDVYNNIVSNTQDPSKTDAGPVGAAGCVSPTFLCVRQNVWNITGFEGNGIDIHHNFVGYSHAPNTASYYNQGGGIRFKHGSDPATRTAKSYIRRNSIWNTENPGTVNEGDKRWVYGNLIQGSSFCGADSNSSGPGAGNFNYFTDRRFYNNTCVTGTHVISAGTTSQAYNVMGNSGSPALDGSSAGGLIFTGNVINDSAQTSYGGGNFLGMLGMQPYGPDANYTAFITNRVLESSNNCFYNSAVTPLTSGFPIYSDNGSTSFGGTVNFANWKLTPYLQDTTSTNGNPTLSANLEVTTNCPVGTIGWEAEWPSGVVPTATPTATPAPAQKLKGSNSFTGRKGNVL